MAVLTRFLSRFFGRGGRGETHPRCSSVGNAVVSAMFPVYQNKARTS